MDVRNRYTEALSCAAAVLGGVDRLAQFLDVPRPRLARWLAGEEAPPPELYITALDVITDSTADR
jgi:hypothetical protein